MKSTDSSSPCLFVADLAQAAIRSALSALKENGFDESISRSADGSENTNVKAA